MACINENLKEYQALKNMSGIPKVILDFYCSEYLDKFDRFPKLDELPHVNSESYLKESLNVSQIGDLEFADNEAIQSNIGATSAEEATVKINSIHKDLEVKIIPVSDKKSLLDITHRPSKYNTGSQKLDTEFNDTITNKKVIFRQMLNKMRELYGINTIEMDSDEIRQSDILKQVPDALSARAFIFNGDIYINSDLATLDAPVHEMLHLLLGAMRYTNPVLYSKLLDKVQDFKSLNEISKKYPYRTSSDLLEEVFVSEFANYVSGLSNEFESFEDGDISEMLYEITRNLDTMLMGNLSVKGLSPEEIFDSSILQLAAKTQSPAFNRSSINMMDLADMHRRTANYKSKLMQDGELEEQCD